MTCIAQLKDRFCTVAHDGRDPLTRREQRRWHPTGHDRHDPEAVAARIDDQRASSGGPWWADPVRVVPPSQGDRSGGTFTVPA
jgi:hypothetical protein